MLPGAVPIGLDLQHLVVQLNRFGIMPAVKQLFRLAHGLFGLGVVLARFGRVGKGGAAFRQGKACPGESAGRGRGGGHFWPAHARAQFFIQGLQRCCGCSRDSSWKSDELKNSSISTISLRISGKTGGSCPMSRLASACKVSKSAMLASSFTGLLDWQVINLPARAIELYVRKI